MINLLLSLAAGVAVAAAVLLGSSFGWAAAIVPGAVAAVAAYVLLSRRTFKRLEALFEEAQKEISATLPPNRTASRSISSERVIKKRSSVGRC